MRKTNACETRLGIDLHQVNLAVGAQNEIKGDLHDCIRMQRIEMSCQVKGGIPKSGHDCSGFGFARRVRFPSLLLLLLLNKARGVAFVLFASLSLLLILLLRTTKREGEVPEENFPSLPLVVVVVPALARATRTESCIFFYSSSYSSSEDSRLENFRILYINLPFHTHTVYIAQYLTGLLTRHVTHRSPVLTVLLGGGIW